MFRPHQGKERSLLVGRFCINEESPQDLVLVSAYSFSSRQRHERGGQGEQSLCEAGIAFCRAEQCTIPCMGGFIRKHCLAGDPAGNGTVQSLKGRG